MEFPRQSKRKQFPFQLSGSATMFQHQLVSMRVFCTLHFTRTENLMVGLEGKREEI